MADFAAGVGVRFGWGLADAARAGAFFAGFVALPRGAFDFFGAVARLEAALLVAVERAAFPEVAPAFVALRTGAFLPVGRLASGFGRADFALSLRVFADDVAEAPRVFGREAGLLTPLMMGSLMRSYSVIKMTHGGVKTRVA